MESRKRLLTELYRETEWLSQRSRKLLPRLSQPLSIPPLPTALHLYGCVFDASWAAPPPKPTPCLVSSATDATARLRPQWAVLAPPQKAFADDVETQEVNPQLRAQAIDRDFLWLHDPYFALDPASTIMAGVQDSPRLRNLRKVLGDGGVLSPVSQPQINYHFHAKRNKRKACSIHGALHPTPEFIENLTPEQKAFRAGWDRTEPLTLPPLCSCPDTAEIVHGHHAILRKLELKYTDRLPESDSLYSLVPESTHLPDPPTPLPREEPLSPPDPVPKSQANGHSESVESESIADLSDPIASAIAFLEERKVCSQCGGLQYFPFSFIEIPLHQEMAGLTEVCERIPLPHGTDVFTDGPKVTACMIAKTPKHEWDIYTALYAVDEHHNAAIYDVCSIHFFPGYQVSELYWSRHIPRASPIAKIEVASPGLASPGQELPSPTAPQMDSCALPPTRNRPIPHQQDYPLRPPPQYPLNLCHAFPPPFCNRISNVAFTAPQLRRIFCVGRRKIPEDFDPSKHISAEVVRSLEVRHAAQLDADNHTKTQTEIGHLRKSIAQLDRQLTQLKLEAAVIRVRDPKAPHPTETSSVNRINRLQVVNGPSEDRGTRTGSPYRQQRDRNLNDRRFQRGYMPPQGSAAASRLRGSHRQGPWK